MKHKFHTNFTLICIKVNFIILLISLTSQANASLLLENLTVIQPEAPHVSVMRFFSTPEEALEQCNEVATARINGATGCYLTSGVSADGSVTRYVGGWFGKCISSVCNLNPNGFVYLDFRACTFGYEFVGSSQYCVKETLISINGSSSTSALPLGPALPQTVKIIDTRGKTYGVSIKIDMFENGIWVAQVFGSTDKTGTYIFQYLPPFLKGTQITLKATCSECDNSAEQEINVQPVRLEEPSMCRAE